MEDAVQTQTDVYSADGARDAVRRFPVSFRRLSDNMPASASDTKSLCEALAHLFVNGNTRVTVSYPPA